MFAKNCHASEDFSVSQSINYYIDQSGNASVSQNITITNLLSQVYLKEYTISLGETVPSQISAHDQSGNIIKSIETESNNTKINLQFPHPEVGRGQTTAFTINYNRPNFAVHKGQTWEMQLPVFNPSLNDQISLTLNTPSSFGKISFASTQLIQTQDMGDRQTITVTYNASRPNEKILIVLGNHQLFSFELKYFLSNTDNQPVNTEIAVPPDTNTQKVTFQNFSPSPTNIKLDPDGNWLAQYTIPANTDLDVVVSGQVKVLPPFPVPDSTDPNRYLEAKQYWPVDSPQIINTVATLKDVSAIYRFVVNYLNYDYSAFDQAKRQGALNALKNPNNALCTEFSDLFVSLARAKSIPAREIEGYAFTNNPKIKPVNSESDVLHAWPQYYDHTSHTWISVDPTWEKTTNGIDYFSDLDLNHIVFVTHGIDSIYPPPPGSYRQVNSQKTVSVDFANTTFTPQINPPQITIKLDKVILTNPNLISLNQLEINSTNWTKDIPKVPPLGQITFTIPRSIFSPKTVWFQSQEISQIAIIPSGLNLLTPQNIVILIISLSLIGLLLCFIPKKNEKGS